MTLDEMCISAARYSDRIDEFEKNEDGEYEDDALIYFEIFRDAINEAYMQVSREFALPDVYETVKVGVNGKVDLADLENEVFTVKDVLNSDKTSNLKYHFTTKYEIEVEGVSKGDVVTIFYHYKPERLSSGGDEPIFSESTVDPMVYICLAVARIWMSEKKFDYANQWLQQYYMLIKGVKSGMKSRIDRRIPRGSFR